MPVLIDLPGPAASGGHTAAFLLEGPEPALVDCGPAVALPDLEAGLAARGLALGDVRHLLLTHIHLDHAGAAGLVAAASPELVVWVHERGARHLVDPSRLVASARRVFGDDLDRLFGEMAPVPAERVRAIAERTALPVPGGVLALPTPGHARHHLAYLTADGVACSGDVGGAAPPGSRYLLPDAPPPDIDIPAWQASLAALVALRPSRLAVAHCAILEDPVPLLEALSARLPVWQGWAAGTLDAFRAAAEAEVRAEADPEHVAWLVGGDYADGDHLAHTYDGLRRSLGLEG